MGWNQTKDTKSRIMLNITNLYAAGTFPDLNTNDVIVVK